MPSAFSIFSGESFSSRDAAAAAAITPTMPVVCQPPTFEALKFARTIRAAISQPTMNAATHSEGDAPVVSASGRIAGITGETAWPLR